MKKYTFVINVLVGKECYDAKQKRMVKIETDAITNRVLTPLYLEEIIYEAVAESYEEAVTKAQLRSLEITRRYADMHRLASTFISCDNKMGEKV